MKSNGLVSIIIPIYNTEKYLQKCIDSVINQTHKNLEIILVDDGSSDNSLKICNDFKQKDKRIKVIHKENGGLGSARNFGIELATGKYLTFLDSDDFIHSNMIKFLYNIAIQGDFDIVSCEGVNYSDFSKLENEVHIEDYTIKSYTREECLKKCHLASFLTATKKLYKRDIFRELRFKEDIIHEDAQISPYIYDRIDKMCYTDVPYYYRFYHNDSITRATFSKKNFDLIKVGEDRIEFYEKNHYEFLYEQGYVFLLSNIIFLYLKAINGEASTFDKKKIMNIYRQNYKKYYRKIKLKNKIKYFAFYCMPNLTIKLFNLTRDFNKNEEEKHENK